VGLRTAEENRASRLLDGVAVWLTVGFIVALLGFLGFAYWRLFRSDVNDLLVCASLVFALLNLIRLGALAYDEGQQKY
jgi:hypothetical protein